MKKKNIIVLIFTILILSVGAYFILDWYQKEPINSHVDFKSYIGDEVDKGTKTYELDALIDKNQLKLELYKVTKTNRNLDLRNQRLIDKEFIYTTLDKSLTEDNKQIYYQYLFIFAQEEKNIDLTKLPETLKVRKKEIKAGYLYLIEGKFETAINMNELVKLIKVI
ncbi:MAG: hypothetical protein RSA06_05315 [Erysipelotrichaceae bacterium]